MMDKTTDRGGAEIEKTSEIKPSTTTRSSAAGEGSSPLHESITDEDFEDLADLGVQQPHRWRKDARHSLPGHAVSVDVARTLGTSSIGSRSSTNSGGRMSPSPLKNNKYFPTEFDDSIVGAISSDTPEEFYTSGSDSDFCDSDTDAVAYPSDSEGAAEEHSNATEGASSAKKKKKDKKKKKKEKEKKEKKKKKESKRLSTSSRASGKSDGKTDKKKKRKSKEAQTATIAEEQFNENEAQKEIILKLQNQLSEALQKVVTTTEEHIRDKGNFLKVSTECTELKGEITVLTKARDDALGKIQAKETTLSEQGTRIKKLEEAVERQLDLQEELESKLDGREEEINKLLEEIEELERASSDDPAAVGATSRVLQAQLDQCKSKLKEKETQIEEYKAGISELEKEVEEGRTVNRLQVNDMEETNISLQGKLKAERLDMTRKLEHKDEIIEELLKEIEDYKRTDDVQDLVAAKEKLNEVMIELDKAKAANELAMQDFATVNGQKEDLLEKLDVLTTQSSTLRQENKELDSKAKKSHLQVLEWTEKTYDWKSRAEAAEKKLQGLNGGGEDDAAAAPQGMFLQAIMDNQAAKQQRKTPGPNLRRSVQGWFTKNPDDELSVSDADMEQMRIEKLEERNATLDSTIGQLRSEIVKLQSSHKEKLYSLQKELDATRGENDALKLKNETLEHISNP